MRDQVSYPDETAGKIIVLILVLFLDSREAKKSSELNVTHI
jgi:hypothetical protein